MWISQNLKSALYIFGVILAGYLLVMCPSLNDFAAYCKHIQGTKLQSQVIIAFCTTIPASPGNFQIVSWLPKQDRSGCGPVLFWKSTWTWIAMLHLELEEEQPEWIIACLSFTCQWLRISNLRYTSFRVTPGITCQHLPADGLWRVHP